MITERNHNREGHISATVGVGVVIAKGMTEVKELNSVVRNQYRNDPMNLAAWTSASHVERHKGKGPFPAPSAPTTPPPSEPTPPKS
jgi:hypothetical protein